MVEQIKENIIDIILSVGFEKWEKSYVTKINDVEIYLRVDVSYPSGCIMIGDVFISEKPNPKIEKYYLELKKYTENTKKISIETQLQKIYDSIK